jgi:hypothetical protein
MTLNLGWTLSSGWLGLPPNSAAHQLRKVQLHIPSQGSALSAEENSSSNHAGAFAIHDGHTVSTGSQQGRKITRD